MTTKAKTKSARKPAAKKTPKNLEATRIQRPPKPVQEIRFNPVLYILNAPEQELWSLSLGERLKKQFAKSGLSEVVSDKTAGKHNGPVIVVRGDAVIDQPLIPVLLRRRNFLLLSDDPASPSPVAASVRSSNVARAFEILRGTGAITADKLLARAPSQLDIDYWKSLRGRETPYAMIFSAGNKRAIEWRLFLGTCKGPTDLLTKYLWPVPAFYATRFLARLGATPNMVTTAAAVMTVLAFWLFFKGQFVTGLLAAWTMTFLDTLDEKLARTTLTSSKWVDYFDRIIDLVHPPIWYAAWCFGLLATGAQWSDGLFWGVLAVILSGYVLLRLIEATAVKWLGLEIHTWRPIDTMVRQVTAPGNPNLVLLTLFTAIAGPDWGLLAVALWTVICLGLVAIQMAQALRTKRTTGALTSWMTKR